MGVPSLASKRPAATSLPTFSLPPPPEIPSMRYPRYVSAIMTTSPGESSLGPQRAPPLTSAGPWATSLNPPSSFAPFSSTSTNTTAANITKATNTASTNVLTPSGVVPDGLGSSGSHSSSSQSSPPGGQPLYYSNHMTGSWSTPGGSQIPGYTYASSGSGPAPPGPLAQPSYSRGPPSYGSAPSPSLQHFAVRNSSSAPNGESLPAPQSYQDHPVYPSSGGAGGVGGGPLGSPLGSQTHGGHQHGGLARPATSEQSTAGGSAAAQEGGSYRPPPTPNNCYPPTSTPQQSSFPQYQSTVTQQSPITSPTTSSGPMPRGHASIPPMAPPLQFSGGRSHHMPPLSYASYGQIPGPVLSNMHHPGAPLTMVGGMQGVGYGHHHPGLPHHPHNIYLHHPSGPAHQSDRDRPFKCNECQHAFNRNHDLKRHKRIHMAVKPFPCVDCDKRFSRKDALKVSPASGCYLY